MSTVTFRIQLSNVQSYCVSLHIQSYNISTVPNTEPWSCTGRVLVDLILVWSLTITQHVNKVLANKINPEPCCRTWRTPQE